MRDQQKSISQFFRSTLRAPLRNDRWSWGAVHPATGQIFLRVWEDEREIVDGVPCILIHAETWGNSSRGRPERERQVELMRNGTQAYGVVCMAKELEAPVHRTIKSFETETLLRFGRLIEKADFVYAVIAGTVTTEAVQNRVRIPAGITVNDVKTSLQRLSLGELHQFGLSTGWDVVYEDNRYPQKAVLGLAAQRLAERPLGPYDFKAGECRRILTRLGFPPVPKLDVEQQRAEEDDAAEAEIRQRAGMGPTERESLIKARRGQGIFRQNLEAFEKRCRITGLIDRAHLRASHIKPWRASTDIEKLDGNNGILLSPHVDHLFDRGYISFEDSGDLLVADALKKRVLKLWGIPLPRGVGAFRPKQFKYLNYHRRNVFLGRED